MPAASSSSFTYQALGLGPEARNNGRPRRLLLQHHSLSSSLSLSLPFFTSSRNPRRIWCSDSSSTPKPRGFGPLPPPGAEKNPPSTSRRRKNDTDPLMPTQSSALQQKKAEEEKQYGAIDYDAPVKTKDGTIGMGAKIGARIAVGIFGLVFAFGDFLPYGSVSTTEEATTVDPNISSGEREILKLDLLLGKAYSDWSHVSDAVSVYDQLIASHPDDFRGYLAKGIILKEYGNVGDAERMFIQARFFAPAKAKALVNKYSR